MKYFNLTTFLSVLGLLTALSVNGQVPKSIAVSLEWESKPIEVQYGGVSTKVWRFEDGAYLDHQTIPYYTQRIALPNHGVLEAKLHIQSTSELNPMGVNLNVENTKPIIDITYEMERRQHFAWIKIFPVYREGGAYQKLDIFKISLAFAQTPKPTVSRGTPTKISKLKDGQIFKFSIKENGIYKISATFLKDLGIDIASVNPQNIQLLGNTGKRLPELLATDRMDDLAENAIFISGEQDGVFNDDDFILFYATGPKPMVISNQVYHIENNPYSDKAYYYIKIADSPGARIQNKASLSSAVFSTNEFLDCQKYELDKVNLLDLDPSSEGGGNEWFGGLFKVEKTKTFGSDFNFPNIKTDKEATIRVRFAARSTQSTNLSISVEDKTFQGSFSGLNGTWAPVADVRNMTNTFFPKGTSPNISLTYNAANISDGIGWLDYIEVNAIRDLKYEGEPLYFGSLAKVEHASTSFDLNVNSTGVLVWDITNVAIPMNQLLAEETTTKIAFAANTNTPKRYVAFKESDDFLSPVAIGNMANQNIHGIEQADFIILYHVSLKAEAEKLALHRTNQSNMNIVLVDVDDLFNEFSSGIPDVSAIRDFAKMVYDRDPNFKYLLLMGDGHYDPKNIHERDPSYNLIPVRESQTSVDKINTFPSDDFYGLLSDDEGSANMNGALDIAIGRITAETPTVADAIVEKIIFYDTSPTTLKPWRTELLCIGDDDDSALHMRQTAETADVTEQTHPIYSANKVLLDAFPQVPAPYGDRFPEATKRINESVQSGSLVLNYFGHGGANGLAQERVLTLQTISNWVNMKDNLPLIITASCSTAGFDDPSIKTFGEELLKNPTGGAIALYSTVRPVYASDNEKLIDATFPEIFLLDNGQKRTVGEILRVGKNKVISEERTRKFLLLGDPSMLIAIPDNNIIVTDEINGIDPKTVDSVAIQALTKVTIGGHVADAQGQIKNDFNGTVYIKIFDKKVTLKTLGQDNAPFAYTAPKGIVFKGNATVTDGKFAFSFVVPKDVVSHGFGKIKYYASDLISTDAAGYETKLYIGGTGGDVIVDDTPPIVELFMNDESFVAGGITNNHPTIFAKISDDNGINISGSGVGHDLTATINGEIKVVNNYYEANADDYTNGEMQYPLENLPIGEHSITIKAWDVANNSGSAKITFVVADTEGAALAHVLNYPNPFTDNTSFQFEHNLSGPAKVRISIYSVDGKIIKTIDKEIETEGFRVTDITWDGIDDYGGQLAKGVYIYQVKMTSMIDTDNSTSSDFEKLVIMK